MAFDPFGPFRGSRSPKRAASAAPGARATRRVPWHQRREWTRAARQFLRWYSRRSDFSLRVRPGQKRPLACVRPDAKRVEVTTAFPQPAGHADFDLSSPAGSSPSERVRGHQALAERPTEVWLRGFIAHEAGHIHHSGRKPKPEALGWLWNALEDERMERLQAARYGGELAGIFSLMGDVMLTETEEERSERLERAEQAERRAQAGEDPAAGDVMAACLQWRWLHDHAPPGRGYHPYLALPEEPFGALRPMIQRAWEARTSDDVTAVAREIMERFGIPAGAGVPDRLEGFDLPGGAAPGGTPRPAPGEAQGASGKGASDKGASDTGDPAGEAPAGENCGSDEDDEGRGGGAEDDSSEQDPPEQDSPEKEGGPDGNRPEGAPGERSDGEAPPQAPIIDPGSERSEAAHGLLDGQRLGARALSEALRPRAPSRLRRPHRSRGRFSYRRHARGADRIFERRPEEAEPPAFVTVLLDMSGSMADYDLFGAAKRCVALLSAAAEMAGTDLRVIPFQTRPGRPLGSRGAGHEALRVGVAALRADGNTELAPALRAGLEPPAGSAGGRLGRHVVALISDGRLLPGDAERCQKVYRRARRRAGSRQGGAAPVVLPLLLGAAAQDGRAGGGGRGPSGAEVYERVFGRYAAIRDASELSEVARRWLRHAA